MKKWLAQAQQEPPSLSNWRPTPSQHQGSSSASKCPSGTHPNPSFSSSESKRPPLPPSGGIKLSCNPEGGTKLIQPGISSPIRPAFKLSSKAKSVSWAPSKDVILPSGEAPTLPLQLDVKNILPLPGREGYLTKMAAQQSPAPDVEQASRHIEQTSPHNYSDLPPPPGREGYFTKMAAQQSPSKDFINDSTNVIDKLRKFKLLPRFRRQ